MKRLIIFGYVTLTSAMVAFTLAIYLGGGK